MRWYRQAQGVIPAETIRSWIEKIQRDMLYASGHESYASILRSIEDLRERLRQQGDPAAEAGVIELGKIETEAWKKASPFRKTWDEWRHGFGLEAGSFGMPDDRFTASRAMSEQYHDIEKAFSRATTVPELEKARRLYQRFIEADKRLGRFWLEATEEFRPSGSGPAERRIEGINDDIAYLSRFPLERQPEEMRKYRRRKGWSRDFPNSPMPPEFA